MHIGYARIGTADQRGFLEAQLAALAEAGCGRCFSEQVASHGQRHQLGAALAAARDGDVLVVTAPDRAARSVADLLAIVSRLGGQNTGFLALSMGGTRLDTRTDAGVAMLATLGAAAAFERSLVQEWRRDAAAMTAASRPARMPAATRRADDVLRMLALGLRPADVAHRMGIGTTSVYRIMAGAKELVP